MDNHTNSQDQYTNGEHPGLLIPSLSKEYEQTYGRPSRPPKKKKEAKTFTLRRRTLVFMVAFSVLLSGIFGVGGAMIAGQYYFKGDTGSSSSAKVNTTGFDLEDATGSAMTVQEITKKAQDSVVEIKTESVGADAWMQQYVTEGAGSGVIIKSNGYIVTNNHVISGANKITVRTRDKKEYEAKVVGADSNTDLAVLKIDAKNLTAATMGNSDQLNVGDMAVAIGNPLGELGGTVTAGIISALDRSLSIEGKTMSLLQTDTSINPGNSGGGLFNQHGQLVGIVVAKSSGSDVEGLGFAIPVNRAADITSQLMEDGYVRGQVTTGMAYADMSSQQAGGMDEFFGNGGGDGNSGGGIGAVYIQEVQGKEAKKAGFQQGDLVISVDGEKIDSVETLSSIITSHKVGDTVEYLVSRNNQVLTLKLKLAEKKGADS